MGSTQPRRAPLPYENNSAMFGGARPVGGMAPNALSTQHHPVDGVPNAPSMLGRAQHVPMAEMKQPTWPPSAETRAAAEEPTVPDWLGSDLNDLNLGFDDSAFSEGMSMGMGQT